jgi:hypothetical protein
VDTFLVDFRLGRVLLHLAAMIGDGAVRFHVAGIRRELASTTRAACGALDSIALPRRIRVRVKAVYLQPARHGGRRARARICS